MSTHEIEHQKKWPRDYRVVDIKTYFTVIDLY